MKVAIVGSRDFPQLNKVRREIDRLAPEDVVLTGDARGVDETAYTYCMAKDRRVIRYEVDKVGLPPWPGDDARRSNTPEWKAYRAEYAKRAHARNERLIADADRVVALWDGKSSGTENALKHARRLQKPIMTVMARLG